VALSVLELATGKMTTFHSRGVDNGEARFSPDGRWLAFSSDESGRFEVYLAAFPGPGEKVQLSTSGGYGLAWRRDGKELYYLSSDGKLMAVQVRSSGPSIQADAPQVLFEPHPLATAFDAAPDGQRFLVVSSGLEQSPPITLIQNWAPRQTR
jgi:Tol biopolymer transport system component